MSRTTNPAFQIYPADILRSEDLRKCTWATRGIWWDILCLMWFAEEQGKITGTKEELCRLVGCTVKELEMFLFEASNRKFANVTFCNKNVTIVNRRMHREFIARKATKNRVSQHRQKQGQKVKRSCNKDVTTPSSSSSSNTPQTPHGGAGVSSSRKQKKLTPTLLPIAGKFCSEDGCGMPAVYRTGRAYDFWYCLEHIPPKKKVMLREQGYDL